MKILLLPLFGLAMGLSNYALADFTLVRPEPVASIIKTAVRVEITKANGVSCTQNGKSIEATKSDILSALDYTPSLFKEDDPATGATNLKFVSPDAQKGETIFVTTKSSQILSIKIVSSETGTEAICTLN
jgi:hypothetical protein